MYVFIYVYTHTQSCNRDVLSIIDMCGYKL